MTSIASQANGPVRIDDDFGATLSKEQFRELCVAFNFLRRRLAGADDTRQFAFWILFTLAGSKLQGMKGAIVFPAAQDVQDEVGAAAAAPAAARPETRLICFCVAKAPGEIISCGEHCGHPDQPLTDAQRLWASAFAIMKMANSIVPCRAKIRGAICMTAGDARLALEVWMRRVLHFTRRPASACPGFPALAAENAPAKEAAAELRATVEAAAATLVSAATVEVAAAKAAEATVKAAEVGTDCALTVASVAPVAPALVAPRVAASFAEIAGRPVGRTRGQHAAVVKVNGYAPPRR